MTYLKTHRYTVLALRDLGRYLGTDQKPANPQAVIDERIQARKQNSN